MYKLRAHLITAPRWFALPAAVAGVALGWALVQTPLLNLGLVAVVAALLMAYSHVFNGFADWTLTGFDKSGPAGRSAEKIYTAGQGLIARGLLSPSETLIAALVWLALAAIVNALLSSVSSLWVWLPFVMVVPLPLLYSYGKRVWLPEVVLGFGFATCAVWLGMSVSGSIDWWTGFLASIPFFLLFGVMAEHVDQYSDYSTDWPKGGRSLGLLTAHLGIPLWQPLSAFIVLIYLGQIALVYGGTLSEWTYLTFTVTPVFAIFLGIIGKEFKVGVAFGLAAITLYQALLVAGQIIGG